MGATASEDWKQLVGHTVELRRRGRHVRYGVVEEVSGDSSIMWLRFDGINGRQLIMKGEGYDLLIID